MPNPTIIVALCGLLSIPSVSGDIDVPSLKGGDSSCWVIFDRESTLATCPATHTMYDGRCYPSCDSLTKGKFTIRLGHNECGRTSCSSDEELFGGKCYKKCADLLGKKNAVRTGHTQCTHCRNDGTLVGDKCYNPCPNGYEPSEDNKCKPKSKCESAVVRKIFSVFGRCTENRAVKPRPTGMKEVVTITGDPTTCENGFDVSGGSMPNANCALPLTHTSEEYGENSFQVSCASDDETFLDSTGRCYAPCGNNAHLENLYQCKRWNPECGSSESNVAPKTSNRDSHEMEKEAALNDAPDVTSNRDSQEMEEEAALNDAPDVTSPQTPKTLKPDSQKTEEEVESNDAPIFPSPQRRNCHQNLRNPSH